MLSSDHQLSPVKTFNLHRNGNKVKFTPLSIQIHPNLKFEKIQDIIILAWSIKIYELRLFNEQGVELFDEDLMFIKDKSIIYASGGEEFDTYTSYSEYLTIRVLGQGGFGKVILAQHKTTKLQVAIKIVDTKIIGNAHDINMVFQEAELLKSLDHKNIVKIYSCHTLQNMQVVFIMEYLKGGELLEYLDEKGPLEEEEARIFFFQITEAMRYCHAKRLIHRDLKLENILLANKDQRLIKIIDFGIAGIALNMNSEKINIGSLRYMAPETLTGALKEIGPKIDVWAMGVILFTLVTGYFPFSGSTSQEAIKAITTNDYSFGRVNKDNRTFSPELQDLIQRIFVQDPQKRIKLKEIIQHPWMKSLNIDEPFTYANTKMDKYLMNTAPISKQEIKSPKLIRILKHQNDQSPEKFQICLNIPQKETQQDELLSSPKPTNRSLNHIKQQHGSPKLSYLFKNAQQSLSNSPQIQIGRQGKLKISTHVRTESMTKAEQNAIFSLPLIKQPPQLSKFYVENEHEKASANKQIRNSLFKETKLPFNGSKMIRVDKKQF